MAKSQKKHHKKGSQRHKKSSLHKNKKIGSQKQFTRKVYAILVNLLVCIALTSQKM